MALDTAFYLVTKDIAIRSGLVDVRYRTLDGRFILDNKDLSRVRFTTDEYVSGLVGVEKITEAEAQTLIAKGGYKKGLMVDNSPTTNGFANEAPVVDSETSSDETQGESTTEQTEEEQVENNEEETNKQKEEEE